MARRNLSFDGSLLIPTHKFYASFVVVVVVDVSLLLLFSVPCRPDFELEILIDKMTKYCCVIPFIRVIRQYKFSVKVNKNKIDFMTMF